MYKCFPCLSLYSVICDLFQVSVYADCTCQYLYWPRQSLEYVLLKEPFLATVLNTIMGRDITNKLYALNNRAKVSMNTCTCMPIMNSLFKHSLIIGIQCLI